MMPTREPIKLLQHYLDKIKWSLKHCGCNHYTIQDHNGIDTPYLFWDTSITYKNGNTVSAFDIKRGNIKIIEDNMVCIGTNNNFVLFMNHDL